MYVACWCIGYCSTAVSSAYGDRLTMGMTAVEHRVRQSPYDDLFFAMYGPYQAIDKYNMVLSIRKNAQLLAAFFMAVIQTVHSR